MKLLLVYPKLAKKPDSRISRAGVQLHGIAQTTQIFLDRCTDKSVNVQSFAYENDANDMAASTKETRQRLLSNYDDTKLIIDISPAPESNIAPADFAGPVIHLSPTFSGSFVCNDINVQGCGNLLQGDVMQCVTRATDKHKYILPSTHELDANMHYASFSPLPTRVSDAFYRNEKDHALVFLSYPEGRRDEKTINNDLVMLSEVLHNVESLRSVTFVCETLNDLPLITQVADGLQDALGLTPSIWGLRRGEYHDMYSIMAKSSVVLCGGSSLYADAIIQGMPVFPWRSEQDGTAPMADLFSESANDKEKLVTAQRAQLDTLIEAQYFDGALPNFRPCFELMLSELINQATGKQATELKAASAPNPQWVIAPARLSEQRNLPDKLSRSLWNDRQKMLQFKQSTNRKIQRRNERNDRQVFTRL